jgi:hypothetical protein
VDESAREASLPEPVDVPALDVRRLVAPVDRVVERRHARELVETPAPVLDEVVVETLAVTRALELDDKRLRAEVVAQELRESDGGDPDVARGRRLALLVEDDADALVLDDR